MEHSSMWDFSPSQANPCGKFRTYPMMGEAWDIARMGAVFDIDATRALIIEQMAAKGLSRRKLSTLAGLSETSIRDLLARTGNPGISTLLKIADALEIPFEAFVGLKPQSDADNDAEFQLPSEGTLTSTFAVLLNSLGIDPNEDGRARRLAKSFPDALQVIVNLESKTAPALPEFDDA